MGKLVRCISTDGTLTAMAVNSTDIVSEAERIHKTFDERLENVRFSRKKSTEKEKKWRNMAENTGKSVGKNLAEPVVFGRSLSTAWGTGFDEICTDRCG